MALIVFWDNFRILALVFLLAGIVLFCPSLVLALQEYELAVSFESHVRPFFDRHFTVSSFKGASGVTLRYAVREVPDQQGILVLVKGRTEFLTKYAELFYDLQDMPFSIYILDHRGQGESDRLLPDHDKGHVVDFKDYVRDLSIFIDTVVKSDSSLTPAGIQPNTSLVGVGQRQRAPLFLLSHSMGGTVAALYANSHPGKVQGMIFCAPMLAIKTKPFPVFVARLIAQGASRMGLEASYVLGGGPYDPTKSFDRNDLTHSHARFCLNQKLIASASVNALGSPTYGWIDQAFAGMRLLGEDHGKLTMPVLLLQAGADTVVDNRPLVDFCAHLPVCTFVDLPGAKHEILMEEDSIRNRAITLIRNFLLSQTPVKHQQGEQGSSSIRERQP